MFAAANPDYKPISSQTLTNYVASEAGFVHSKQLEHLWLQMNITLTFDGGSTRRPQSVYTMHATTPDRDVFCIHGEEGTDVSHTGEHLANMLIKV
jgi:hypothetical protein